MSGCNACGQTLNVVQNDRVCYVGIHWHNPDILASYAVIDDLFRCLVNTP